MQPIVNLRWPLQSLQNVPSLVSLHVIPDSCGENDAFALDQWPQGSESLGFNDPKVVSYDLAGIESADIGEGNKSGRVGPSVCDSVATERGTKLMTLPTKFPQWCSHLHSSFSLFAIRASTSFKSRSIASRRQPFRLLFLSIRSSRRSRKSATVR